MFGSQGENAQQKLGRGKNWALAGVGNERQSGDIHPEILWTRQPKAPREVKRHLPLEFQPVRFGMKVFGSDVLCRDSAFPKEIPYAT